MTIYGNGKHVAKAGDPVKGEGAVGASACGRGVPGGFQLDGRPANRISRGVVQLPFPPGVSAGRLLSAEGNTHETEEYLQSRAAAEKALAKVGELRDDHPTRMLSCFVSSWVVLQRARPQIKALSIEVVTVGQKARQGWLHCVHCFPMATVCVASPLP
jgi:hypothetical protein